MPAPRLHPVTTEGRERVGQTLRDHRHAAGLRLIDVATALALTPGYLANVERGRRRANPEMIRRLAAIYRVDLSELAEQVAA